MLCRSGHEWSESIDVETPLNKVRQGPLVLNRSINRSVIKGKSSSEILFAGGNVSS